MQKVWKASQRHEGQQMCSYGLDPQSLHQLLLDTCHASPAMCGMRPPVSCQACKGRLWRSCVQTSRCSCAESYREEMRILPSPVPTAAASGVQPQLQRFTEGGKLTYAHVCSMSIQPCLLRLIVGGKLTYAHIRSMSIQPQLGAGQPHRQLAHDEAVRLGGLSPHDGPQQRILLRIFRLIWHLQPRLVSQNLPAGLGACC